MPNLEWRGVFPALGDGQSRPADVVLAEGRDVGVLVVPGAHHRHGVVAGGDAAREVRVHHRDAFFGRDLVLVN